MVAIPIQALIMRDKNDLEAQARKGTIKKSTIVPLEKKGSDEEFKVLLLLRLGRS